MQVILVPPPDPVRRAAHGRLQCGGCLYFIGRYQDQEVYTSCYPSDDSTLPPEVYLWDGRTVTTITGKAALRFLNPVIDDE